jgi:RNA polymerase sigma-B factor
MASTATATYPYPPARDCSGDRRRLEEATERVIQKLVRLPRESPDHVRLRHELVLLCLPLAKRLAGRYRHTGEPLDDLQQVAALALVNAVNRFDPHRGSTFIAFAAPTILGELRKHFRDRTWNAHVPRRLQELRGRLREAVVVLSQRLGRTPTVTDLAEHLRLDEETIIDALYAAQSYKTYSFDGYGRRQPRLADEIGETDPELERAEAIQTIAPAWRKLPARERKILSMRFFDDRSQSEIAREIGISQMHVSRLIQRSLAFIRKELGVPV